MDAELMLDANAQELLMSEYPADCCPLKCYIHFPCMAGDEDSPFWPGWAALRIKTFRLIENTYFETAVIAMILLSSLALVSGGEGRLVAEGGGGQGEGGGGASILCQNLAKKNLGRSGRQNSSLFASPNLAFPERESTKKIFPSFCCHFHSLTKRFHRFFPLKKG